MYCTVCSIYCKGMYITRGSESMFPGKFGFFGFVRYYWGYFRPLKYT